MRIAPPLLSEYPFINFKFDNCEFAAPLNILRITPLFLPSNVACDDDVIVNFFFSKSVSSPFDVNLPLNFIVSPSVALSIAF